jgi:hypothetical protein
MSNTIPFTTYTLKNASNKGVPVFLGQSLKNNNINTKDYFPHQVSACKTTYLFASVVGTRNVKITRPTTTDPYVYIETRKVEPQQCPQYKPTSLLKSGDNTGLVLRNLSSDSSITIQDNGCNFGLSTYTYDVQNACNINGFYYGSLGSPGSSNVIWKFKEVVSASPCISVIHNQDTIYIVKSTDQSCC